MGVLCFGPFCEPLAQPSGSSITKRQTRLLAQPFSVAVEHRLRNASSEVYDSLHVQWVLG